MDRVLQQKVLHVRDWPEVQRVMYGSLLQKWNYHYQDKLDKIFANTGQISLPITFEPFENYFTGFSFDYYSFNNDDVNGLLHGHWKQEGGNVTIYYANNCPKARQRFNIAHELIHFYQYNDPEFKQELEAIRYDIVRDRLIERIADKAAAYYLVPKPILEGMLQQPRNLVGLRSLFGVSQGVLEICLKDYNLTHLRRNLNALPW